MKLTKTMETISIQHTGNLNFNQGTTRIPTSSIDTTSIKKNEKIKYMKTLELPAENCGLFASSLSALGRYKKFMRGFFIFGKRNKQKPSLILFNWLTVLLLLISNFQTFATIAQRGSATSGTTTNNSLTINNPSDVVSGDFMVVDIAQVGNNTNAPTSTGWTLINGTSLAGGTARYGAVLYRKADGTEGTSFTFTLGTGTTSAVGTIVAFSGVDGTTPFDVTPGSISVQASQTGVAATTITTVTANTAVIMFGMAAASAPTWSGWSTTSPGTLTEIADFQATSASVGAAWASKATAGATGAGAAILSGAERNGGILIALRPAVPTYTSTGSGGNWNSVSTWDLGSVPTAGSNVVISSSAPVTVDINTASLTNLTINSSLTTGTYTVSGTGTLTLAAAGTLYVGAGGFPTGFTSAALASGSTVNYNNAGNQTVSAQTYSNLTLSGSGAKILPTGTTTIGGNLSLSGTATTTTVVGLTINGNLIIGDGTTFTTAAFPLTVTGTTSVGAGTSGSLAITSATGTKTFTGAVTINSGASLAESAAAQLAFGSDVTNNGTLTENGAATVGIAGNFTNNGTYNASTGVHTFSGATKAIGGTNAITIPSATFTGAYTNSGTLNVSTALTVTGVTLTNNGTIIAGSALSGTGTFTQGASSTLNIGGASTITTLTATANGNMVNYSGTAQTVKATSYYNLTLSGSGAKTLTGLSTINGSLTLSGTATTTAAAALTIGGDVNIGLGTTFTAGAYTHNIAGNWTNNGTFTSTGSTINLNGANQSIGGSNLLFNNLTLSGSLTKTFSGAATIGGTLNINNAKATLALGTTSTTAYLILGSSQQASGTYGSTASVASNKNDAYFDSSSDGIVNVSTGCNGTWTGATSTDWNDPTNWCGGTPTSTTDVVIPSGTPNSPHIGATGGTCKSLTINSSATLVMDGAYTLTINGGDWSNSGTFTASTGTVIFTGTSTIGGSASTTFNNVTLGGSAAVTTGAATSIAGALNIGDGTSFTTAGYALTVTGTTTIGGGTSGSLVISSSTGAKLFIGLITVNNGATWNNSGNSAVGLQGGITNNGTFTAGTGAYSFTTNNQAIIGIFSIPSVTVGGITLTNNNSLTVATALSGTGGTLSQTAGSTLNIGGTSGISTLTATATGNTVNYNGTAQTVKATTYYNLTLSGSGAKTLTGLSTINGDFTLSGTATAAAAAALTIGGNVTIGSGTTFTGGTLTHNVAGNWTNNGTFTANTSTINLNGTDQAIGGSTSSFNNLTISNSGTKTLGVNTTVNGTLTVNTGTTLALTSYNLGSPTSTVLYGGATTGSTISGSGTLTLGGNVTVNSAGTGANGATISSPVALAATRTFNVSDDGTAAIDLTINNVVSGAGGITKAGAGTILLSVSNTYSGTTTISAGTLRLGANNALGTNASGTSITSGAVLDLNGINYSASEALALNGTGISSSGALMNSSVTGATYAGNITLGSASSIVGNTGSVTISGTVTTAGFGLTLGGATGGTASGAISGTGTVTKADAGTWIFTANNSYTGATTISAGELRFNPVSPAATMASQVVLSGGKLSTTGISANTTLTSSSTLNLAANSTIELDPSAVHNLVFANSSGVTWNGSSLTINGWQGSLGSSGTAGRIFFGSAAGTLSNAQLQAITIIGFSGNPVLLSTGELVPQPSEPLLSISGSSSDLGSICDGANSSLTYTITNTGSSDATNVTITSSDPQFTVSPGSIGSISANGGIAQFTVTFAPTSTSSGPQSTNITIASDPNGTIINYGSFGTLTGTGKSLPSAAFSYASSWYCPSGNSDQPNVTLTGGTFSATPTGLSLNTSTGIINLTTSQAGDYTVTYTTTANGCSSSSSVSLRIEPKATATLTYNGDTPICWDDASTQSPNLICNYTISGTPTYSQPSGLSIVSNTGVITPSLSTPGSYNVQVNFSYITPDNHLCSGATSAQVIIQKAAELEVVAEQPSICTGTNAIIDIGGTTDPSVTYSLNYTDGVDTYTEMADGVGNNGTLSLSTLMTTPGTYTFTVVATVTVTGCSSTFGYTATVTVLDYPSAIAGPDQTTCANVPVTITGGSDSNGTITWSTSGNGTFDNVHSITPVYTPGSADSGKAITLTLTVSNGICTNATSSKTLHVTAIPALTLPTSSICQGGTTTLSPSTGGTWSVNNPQGTTVATVTSTGVVQGVNAGSATFTFTNSTTGCSNTTSELTVDVGCQFITLTQPDQLTANLSVAESDVCYAGTIHVTVSDIQGGTPPYNVTYGGTPYPVTGSSITIPVTPSSSGTITFDENSVVVSDSKNCTSVTSGTASVTVYGNFTVGSIAGTQNICNNTIPGELTGTAPTGGDGTYSYQWQVWNGTGWDNIPGATLINYQPGALTATTMYHLIQSSGSGCGSVTAGPITVTVYGNLTVGSIISGSQTICYNTAPSELSVGALSGGDGNYTYQWESSTDGGNTWTSISGANGLTYDPDKLTQTTMYHLIQSSGSGCGSVTAGPITVTVYGNLTVGSIISGSQTICYNTAPSELSVGALSGGDGNYTYQWESSTDGGNTWTSISGANGLTYDPDKLTQTTMYHLIQSSGSGCGSVTAGPITVTVYGNLTVGSIISGSQTICYNTAPSELSVGALSGGDGNYTYQWESSTDGGNTWTSISGANGLTYDPDKLTQTTMYHLIQSSGSGCGSVTAGPITVTVYGNLTVGSIISGSQTICYNTAPSELSVGALSGGDGNYTYQWESSTDGGNTWTSISGANGLTYDPDKLTQTTMYHLIQSSGSGCGSVTAGPITVTVYGNLTVGSIISGSQTICYNTAPSELSVGALSGGDGNYTYQWESSIDGGNTWTSISGANGLTYDPDKLTQTTMYHLIQSSGSGCGSVTAGPITVTVYGNLTVGSIISGSQTICYNTAPSELSVGALSGGDGNYTYQWESSTDGGNTWTSISGANGLTYDPDKLTQTTMYHLIQSSGSGCGSVTAGPITVTVYGNLTVGSIISGSQTICYNTAPSELSVGALSGGDGNYTYQWESSTDGGNTWTSISGANGLTYDPDKLTQTTIYHVIQTSGSSCGSVTTNMIIITVNGDFSSGAIATDGQTICYGGDPSTIGSTTPASGGEGIQTYQWQSSIDAAFSSPVTIANSNSATYDPPANLNVTTWYRRQARDGSCSPGFVNSIGVWQVTVIGNLDPGSIATSGDAICYNGDPVSIGSVNPATTGGDGSAITYQWQSSTDNFASVVNNITGATSTTYDPPAGLQATTWYRRVAMATLNNVSCSAFSNSYKVTVNPLPVITISGKLNVCRYQTMNLTASGGVTYNWTGPAGFTATGPTATKSNFQSANAGTYTVTATNSYGCPSTASVVVTMSPYVFYQITTNSPLCEGSTLNLSVTDGASTYTWTGPNGFTSTSQKPFISGVTTLNAGDYRVDAVDACGTSSPTTTVTVYPRPVVTISGSSSECVGAAGVLYSTQSGMSNYSWSIDGGIINSGGTTSDYTAYVTWTTVGNHSISVNYINGNGCTAASPAVYPVTVNPSPVPTLGGATSACLNSSEVYTTESGMSNYVWTVSAGGSITAGGTSGSNTVTVTWNSTGAQTVSVSYTSDKGCPAASPTVSNITVNPLPAPTLSSTKTTVCAGTEDVTYTTQSGMSGYQWTYSDGAQIDGGGTSNDNYITILWLTSESKPVEKSVGVNYQNSFGCPAASPVQSFVTVNPLPDPTISGPSSACINSTGVTYITESGESNYLWIISGGNITAGWGTNQVTVTWNTEGQGFIGVNYSNGSGCIAQDPTLLSVNVVPLPAPLITGETSVCLNSAKDYSTESGMSNYVWIAKGGTISYGSDPWVITVLWNTPGAGTVSVNYTDGNHCMAESPTVYDVTVNTLPSPATMSDPATACQGVDGNVYSIQSGYAKYTWTVTGGDITSGGGIGDNKATVMWNNTGTQTVSVVYENDFGCTNPTPASMNVTVNALPVPTINGSNVGTSSACVNSESTYTTESNMSGYMWGINGDGVITSKMTNTNEITVRWNSAGEGQVFVIYANSSGCVDPENPGFNYVTIHSLPSVTASSNSPVCEGSALNLTATTESTVGSFIWTGPAGIDVPAVQNPSINAVLKAAGDYTVIYTDGNGCVSAPSVTTVAVNAIPVTTGVTMKYGENGSPMTATSSSGGDINWYTADGTFITIGSSFNPVGFTGSGITTSTAPGKYIFWVASTGTPDCKAEADFAIEKADASVTLSDLNQTYDGSPHNATATTIPGGLTVDITYGGSPIAPTNAGSYKVVATIDDPNYQGSATDNMVIGQATATITLGNLTPTYTGLPIAATASTTPPNLTVDLTYNSSSQAPTVVGSYVVTATIDDPNYQGSATDNMVIGKATATITLGNLTPTYTGSPIVATASTTPPNLAVDITYGGSSAAPTNAGSYAVIGTIDDANYQGTASATMIIGKATATVTLGNLNPEYTSSPIAATATTDPSGLTVDFTYDGLSTAPTSIGSYDVVGTIDDQNYQGSAEGTMTIGKETASITLGSLDWIYDGTVKSGSAVTVPSGLTVVFSYTQNGSPAVPVNAGSYAVVATINDDTYKGTANGTLVISPATATVTLGSLNQDYDGKAKYATATTNPENLNVVFTYDNSPDAPINAGNYPVTGTVNDPNYVGSATGTLVINKAVATITLGDLSQTYNGTPRMVSVSTLPDGLTIDLSYSGSPTAPTDAGTYDISATVNDDNYYGTQIGQLVVAKAEATVILGNLNMPYTGSPVEATATTVPADLTVEFTYNGSPLAPTSIGSYAVVGTINDVNYEGSSSGTLIIGKATATVTLSGLVETYDGTAKSVTATTTPAGLTVDITYNSSSTAPTSAGSYAVVATIDDPTYQGSAAGTLTINKATATINVTGYNGPYDGTAHGATGTATGVQNESLAGLDLGAAFTEVPGGTADWKFTDVTGNYNDASGSVPIVINTGGAGISVTGGVFTYDGNAHGATGFAYGAGGVKDELTPAVTFTYSGTGTTSYGPTSDAPVNAGTYMATATFAGNTDYSSTQGTAAITINQASLTISINANDKVYDGNANATISYAWVSSGNAVGSDNITVGSSNGQFIDKNVGAGKQVTANVSISGSNLSNYTYNTTASTTASIKPLSITGSFIVDNKVYDGTATAVVLSESLNGVLGGDAVTLTVGTAAFSDANVGNGKTVTLNGATLTGNDAGNYTLSSVSTTTANITPATLAIAAVSQQKTYGILHTFNTTPPSTDFNITGLQSVDAVTSVAIASDGAAANAPLGTYQITIGSATGTGLSNYNITYTPGLMTVVGQNLVITAASQTKTYGSIYTFTMTNPSSDFSVTGLLPGDAVSSITLSSTGAGAAASAGSSYTITASNAVGIGLSHYSITYVPGTMTVVPKTLDITANNKQKTYGDAVTFAGTEFTTGSGELVNSDLVSSVALTSGGASATAAVGSYDINIGNITGAGLSNYNIVTHAGTLVVNPRTLEITPNSTTKVYGNTVTFTGNEFSVGSDQLANGDKITVTLTCAGADATAETGTYPIVASNAAILLPGLITNYSIVYHTGTMIVTPASLDIYPNSISKVYGNTYVFAGTDFTTGSGELISNDQVTSVALSSAGAAAATDAGTYSITASNAQGLGLDNYTISYHSGTFTVNNRPLNITADNLTKTYGTTVVFTGSEFTTLSGDLVNGDKVTDVTLASDGASASAGAGSYPIVPSAAVGTGLNNYNITYHNGTLLVTGKPTLIVTANNINRTYGAANPAFTATITGYVNGFANDVTGLPSLTTTAAAGSPVGPYTITAAQGSLASANYSFTFVNGTMTVSQATLTVTADNKTKAYGAVNPPLTYTYTGFVNNESLSTSGVTGIPVLSTSATTGSAADTYPITITQGTLAASNYAFNLVNGTLTVTGKPVLTVTANNASRTYGAANPVFTYAITGYVTGVTNDVNGAPSLTTTASAGSPAGSYTITAAIGGLTSSNYTFNFVNGTLTVSKATLTVTADNKTKVVGTANPAFTVTYSGFLNSDNASSLSGSLSITTTATQNSPVGTYPITVTQGTLGSTNYNFTFVNGTLTVVNKPTLTVTAVNQTKAYGSANPTLTVSYSGFLSGDNAGNSLSGSPNISTTATNTSTPGTYTIRVTQGNLSSSKYNFAFVNGTLTVTKAVLTVTADNKSKLYGTANPSLTYTMSGFVLGQTSGSSGITGNPSLSTTATTTTSVGTYPITITNGTLSSSRYSFNFVNGTLTINPRNLTVTANTATKVYGNVDPALTYRITSGSLVGGDQLTGALTRASGENVGSYAIGIGTIAANSNYSVTFVANALTINPLGVRVTAQAKSKVYGQLDPALTFASVPAVTSHLANGQTISFTGSLTRDAGETVAGSPYTIRQGSLANSNYTITYVANNLTITPLAVTVTTDAKTKVQSAPDPALTYVSNPAVGTVLADGQVISFTGSLTRRSGESIGTYPILIGTLSNSNYTITYIGANLTIVRRGNSLSLNTVETTERLKEGLVMKAYPNPFTDHVTFDLQLSTDSRVQIEVFNILGVKLAIVFNKDVTAYDRYQIDYTPENVGSGILLYRLVVDGNVMYTGKLIHKAN